MAKDDSDDAMDLDDSTPDSTTTTYHQSHSHSHHSISSYQSSNRSHSTRFDRGAPPHESINHHERIGGQLYAGNSSNDRSLSSRTDRSFSHQSDRQYDSDQQYYSPRTRCGVPDDQRSSFTNTLSPYEKSRTSTPSTSAATTPQRETPMIPVANPDAATTTQSADRPQGEAWKQLELLQKQKICHHCTTSRWQHSLLPVCSKCQPLLQKVTCEHCMEEFLQHKILQKAEEYFGRSICLACAKNVSQSGRPTRCDLCWHLSVFGSNEFCDRCSQMTSKYGQPETCVRCGNKAAFHREKDKMEKIDNLLLCFLCTTKFKKEKYKSQKKQKNRQEIPSNGVPTDSAGNGLIEKFKREIEKQKALIESLKNQVNNLQQQVKRKDAEVLNFAQKMEQENFLLRKEAEENKRKAIHDESRITQLMKEISEIDRKRDKEITRLIELNQQEREKLNEVIENLKTTNEQLEMEIEKKRISIKESKAALKEEQNCIERYKAITEKRIVKLSHKYSKTIEKHEDQAKQRNKAITELKKTINQLESDCERYLRLERKALGFEQEDELDDDSALVKGNKSKANGKRRRDEEVKRDPSKKSKTQDVKEKILEQPSEYDETEESQTRSEAQNDGQEEVSPEEDHQEIVDASTDDQENVNKKDGDFEMNSENDVVISPHTQQHKHQYGGDSTESETET